MEDLREFRTVILAALLHDSGKFLMRGRDIPIKGSHPEVSRDFVNAFPDTFKPVADLELLRTLVLHHHEKDIDKVSDPRHGLLAHLVNKADRLSAGERGRRVTGGQDYKTTPLASVFPRLFAGEARPQLRRHHPVALSDARSLPRDIFPADFPDYVRGELEKALTTFGDKASPLLRSLEGKDFDTVVSHLLALLAAHTWPIPADTQEEVPDISLYDHLRTTAAIASCLYQYYEERDSWQDGKSHPASGQPFVLAVGDVSGIQEYIFDIQTGTDAPLAKRLRARSLFIQLIGEVVPLKILQEFQLTPANIIMASGGKFYVLLPHLADTEKRLLGIQEEIDGWFLAELRAALGLNLAWVSFGEAGMGQGFGQVMKQAMDTLAGRKDQRSRLALTVGGRWNEERFVLPPFEGEDNLCPACRKFPKPKADKMCEYCFSDAEWGGRLPETNYIGLAAQGDREIAGTWVSLHSRPPTTAEKPLLAVRVNDPDTRPVPAAPATFKYLVKHVPTEGGDVLEFQKIAEKSAGRHYLGFLKMDVDRLGETLAFGLGESDTMSRLATLSRQLDLFFTGWVEHRLETEFTDCYAVFSGGDDLFLVGPWNRILELAERVRGDFSAWTGHNPRLTISAGVVIAPDHYPIHQAAQDAGGAVEESKDKGRDRLTLLGHTVTWDGWEKIKTDWEKLRAEDVSSAFLYSLLEYGRMWKDYDHGKGNVLGLRFQPLLAYNVSRNVKPGGDLERWAKALIDYRPRDAQIELTLDNLGLLAQLLILGKEGGQG